MPKRIDTFANTRFPAEVFKAAYEAIGETGETGSRDGVWASGMSVTSGRTTWTVESFDEFLAEIRRPHDGARVQLHPFGPNTGATADIDVISHATIVAVESVERPKIQRVMAVFEEVADECRIPAPPTPKPTVFVGHGRSTEWMRLKTYLQDQMGVTVKAYETGSRAGHTIRDVLTSMVRSTSFALLVMTGEDVQPDGKVRARQNVVHEAGLFQGALGFERAIVLLEDDVEEFSNLAGIQYLPFRKDSIRDAFGDVIAALKREFPGSL